MCMHVYVYLCEYCVCMCAYICVMHAQVYVCKHVCTCVLCKCIYVYVYVCVCACAQPVQKATCSVYCPKYPSNVATDSTKDSMSILAEKTIF